MKSCNCWLRRNEALQDVPLKENNQLLGVRVTLTYITPSHHGLFPYNLTPLSVLCAEMCVMVLYCVVKPQSQRELLNPYRSFFFFLSTHKSVGRSFSCLFFSSLCNESHKVGKRKLLEKMSHT